LHHQYLGNMGTPLCHLGSYTGSSTRIKSAVP
jgi:hypothetical protein